DHTVKGRIIDKDGGFSEYTASVHVNNVNPSVTAPSNQNADEGASTSFNLGSFTDPGADALWTVDVNWGDGSSNTTFTRSSTGTLGSQFHSYDDGPITYTVVMTVTDKDGGSGTATFQVAVASVAPTASLSNDGPVNEASPATISFSNQHDPSGADTSAVFHYACDFD